MNNSGEVYFFHKNALLIEEDLGVHCILDIAISHAGLTILTLEKEVEQECPGRVSVYRFIGDKFKQLASITGSHGCQMGIIDVENCSQKGIPVVHLIFSDSNVQSVKTYKAEPSAC